MGGLKGGEFVGASGRGGVEWESQDEDEGVSEWAEEAAGLKEAGEMNPSGDAMGMQLLLGMRLQVDVLFGCYSMTLCCGLTCHVIASPNEFHWYRSTR